MTKVVNPRAKVPNFKGKQTTHMYRCYCCWVINDKREKLEKLKLKEMKDELMLDEVILDRESTTEPTRKLASIRRISAIHPIEGADRIVKVDIDGWSVVTQKSNNFEVNDLVVYFEIDSFLPVCDKFEFLRSSSFKSTPNLGDGFRIKTIKLKGQISQGLILPLSEFSHLFFDETNHWLEPEEGDDLTELLGVKKWEKPLSPQLSGTAKGNFPIFIQKTDQERVQNLSRRVDKSVEYEVSLKLDGSSMTVYLNNGEFGVCSRNLDLKETEGNTFWQIARNYEMEAMMRAIGRNLAIQGEAMGPGIQGNREKFDKHQFYLFDIWDIDSKRYLFPEERWDLFQTFMIKNRIHHVPVLYNRFRFEPDVDVRVACLEMAETKSINHPIAEGIVFKSQGPVRHNSPKSFKSISNKFLLKED